MYLKEIEVTNFRGLESLKIELRSNMILIGENSWGRLSLLDALSLIFNPNGELYQFAQTDLHKPIKSGSELREVDRCSILFIFSESYPGESTHKHYHCYKPFMISHADTFARLTLSVIGERKNDKVVTHYQFLNDENKQHHHTDVEECVKQLILQHPVFRFRDARLQTQQYQLQSIKNHRRTEMSSTKLLQELRATTQLLQHYFLENHQIDSHSQVMTNSEQLWLKTKGLISRLQQEKSGKLAKAVLLYLSSVFIEEGSVRYPKQAQPIIILEDLEARLHPRMAAIVWKLATQLPIQRITTTNAVEVLAHGKLEHICRMVRYEHHTQAYQIERNSFKEEYLRRINFHIHYNRNLALFSRTWLLVEGETEVWILSEVAKLLNVDLAMEGIRIVEYAQAGLKPLVRYCQKMGIAWYVLADGDQAGQKYSEQGNELRIAGEHRNNHVMTLPKKDIEHFIYNQGYEDIYLELANWGKEYKIVQSQVIRRAIEKNSKPEVAVAIAQAMEQRGDEGIPLLFKTLFADVLALTHRV